MAVPIWHDNPDTPSAQVLGIKLKLSGSVTTDRLL